jgi:uncharacterized protein YlzI (FlbEa/FlbD family)
MKDGKKMWLKLTANDGDEFLVNMDYIEGVSFAYNANYPSCESLLTIRGEKSYIYVRETLDQIWAMMNHTEPIVKPSEQAL